MSLSTLHCRIKSVVALHRLHDASTLVIVAAYDLRGENLLYRLAVVVKILRQVVFQQFFQHVEAPPS